MGKNTKRTRLSIALPVEIKERLRRAAIHQGVTLQEYVIHILEEGLGKDWAKLADQEGLIAFSSQADPVLAELWDNQKDSAYDRF